MFDYPTFGKITKAINFAGSHFDTIILYFEHKTITLYAYGDCCSHSVFNIPNEDFAPLIGKTMTSITEDSTYIDMTYDGDCKRVTPITIQLDNKTFFKFELHNFSNGYYRGWMEVKEDEPTELHSIPHDRTRCIY